MDDLTYFLIKVCNDNQYRYDKVENLAEIYRINEKMPLALVEMKDAIAITIRFRIGVSSKDIASLSRDMAVVLPDIIFEEDFIIHPDYGYLFGQEATKVFIENIQKNIENAQIANATAGAIFFSDKPIVAYGSKIRSKTNIEKFWDKDLDD